MSLRSVRREYRGSPLDESGAASDPFEQFARWFAEARATEFDATAMALATSTPDGRPSARMVLLKGVEAGGFVFYTNYDSRKAGEIEGTQRAALLFYWPTFERQVRVEGEVTRVPAAESDAYSRRAAPREPVERRGVAAEPSGCGARGARGGGGTGARRARRERAAAAVLGRLPRVARRVRVLAGPREPAARSARVHARRRRLAPSAARTVSFSPAATKARNDLLT